MTFRFVRARAASAACLLVLAAACSSNPQQLPVQEHAASSAGSFFIGARPVYAHLVNERGGSWVFTTVTASDAAADSGYLVRLNDLAPAFDTRAAECTPQVYPASHRCSPLHPFRDKDTGMIDKIINGSIAVGTAGKVTDISQMYETTFDESAFNQAVDEALVNSGLGDERRQLISLLDAYHEEAEAARAELSQMAQQASATRGSNNRVELDVRPTIDGLTAYYQDDIDFAALVELALVTDGDVPTVRLDSEDALPCDVRHCMAAAQSALAALRSDIGSHRDRLSAMMTPGVRIYDVSCDETVHAHYLLSVVCPEQVVVSGEEPVGLPVTVTILSRDFERLYPDFDLADERLRVSLGRRSVTFTNVTDEYITLTAKTVYYNSRSNTTSLPIDIPPGISITRGIDELVSQSIDIESNYRQMTPDKAAGASFQFGIAVRYRVASESDEKTLHHMQVFNVGCVIENRIEPGSCITPAPDGGMPQRTARRSDGNPTPAM